MRSSVVVIEPPEPIVSFEDAAKHLRLEDDEERDHVEALIAAATGWIDGPAGTLRRALGPQLLEWQLDAWPTGNWRWPIVPFLELASVAYVDTDGVDRDWPLPAPLTLADGPAVRGQPGDLRIRYWAGYGRRDPGDAEKWIATVPAQARVAIMMLVAQWYRTREAAFSGTITSEMPFAVDALLQPLRVYR